MFWADEPLCAPESTNGIRVSIATDVDDHASNLTGWTQAYDQLAPGRFRGTLRELWLGPEMQVFEETTSLAVRQSCEVWTGALWFGIPVGDGPFGRIGFRAAMRTSARGWPPAMKTRSLRFFSLASPSQTSRGTRLPARRTGGPRMRSLPIPLCRRASRTS